MIGITLAAEASENHFRRIASQNSWFADILSAKEKLSRKERKERKEMEGGNGASAASEVTLPTNRWRGWAAAWRDPAPRCAIVGKNIFSPFDTS